MLDAFCGGTYAFTTETFDRLGIQYSFTATVLRLPNRPQPQATRVIIIESPMNPLLEVIAIGKVTEFAKTSGIVTVIDNTFASPINQPPLIWASMW